MKYFILVLFAIFTLDTFGQNDRIIFETYWTDPDSKINIPLFIELGNQIIKIPQIVTDKVSTQTNMMVSFDVRFNRNTINNPIFYPTNIYIYAIYPRNNYIIDEKTKKDDFQTYLWNIVTEQLLNWFYVQPYYKLPASIKRELFDTSRRLFMINIQLIPAHNQTL